jgi:hypothetical protein
VRAIARWVRDEFRANMVVPLHPASESVPEHLIVKPAREREPA